MKIDFICIMNQNSPGSELNIMNGVFMFGLPGFRESHPVAALVSGNRNLKLAPKLFYPYLTPFGTGPLCFLINAFSRLCCLGQPLAGLNSLSGGITTKLK
jgi:hypothetical protein